MKAWLSVLLLLICASGALAQRPDPDAPVDDPSFGKPPQILTFEGRQVFRPGGEIKGPYIVSQPDPVPLKDYRAAAVKLWCVIGTDGKAHMCRVAKHDSLESEMKAIATVQQWKFKPAKKKTEEVDTLVGLEVVWR